MPSAASLPDFHFKKVEGAVSRNGLHRSNARRLLVLHSWPDVADHAGVRFYLEILAPSFSACAGFSAHGEHCFTC